MRNIHIGDEVWGYTVGKRNLVIQAPNLAKRTVSFSDLIAFVAPDLLVAWEAGEYQPDVGPSDVKKYAEGHKNLFPAPPKKKRTPGLTRPRR